MFWSKLANYLHHRFHVSTNWGSAAFYLLLSRYCPSRGCIAQMGGPCDMEFLNARPAPKSFLKKGQLLLCVHQAINENRFVLWIAYAREIGLSRAALSKNTTANSMFGCVSTTRVLALCERGAVCMNEIILWRIAILESTSPFSGRKLRLRHCLWRKLIIYIYSMGLLH